MFCIPLQDTDYLCELLSLQNWISIEFSSSKDDEHRIFRRAVRSIQRSRSKGHGPETKGNLRLHTRISTRDGTERTLWPLAGGSGNRRTGLPIGQGLSLRYLPFVSRVRVGDFVDRRQKPIADRVCHPHRGGPPGRDRQKRHRQHSPRRRVFPPSRRGQPLSLARKRPRKGFGCLCGRAVAHQHRLRRDVRKNQDSHGGQR
mmetsp:Transcript_17947/g.41188  ORF Transcript_17947/g.41188 Transcript_17947/m.41188 type:complete len:201 (-) Transcript_17947:895-1497(-)